MAGCSTVAAALVLSWRTRWSHVPQVKHGDRLQAAAEAEEEATAAAAAAEAGRVGARAVLRRRRTLAHSFLRAMAEAGNGEVLLLRPEDVRCGWRPLGLAGRERAPKHRRHGGVTDPIGALLRRSSMLRALELEGGAAQALHRTATSHAAIRSPLVTPRVLSLVGGNTGGGAAHAQAAAAVAAAAAEGGLEFERTATV